MGAGPIIEVKPIYGWGWIVAGEPRFEVPAAFTIRLEDSQPKLWTSPAKPNLRTLCGE